MTAEAKQFTAQNGKQIASFSIAHNVAKDKPAVFMNCKVFGKPAEWLSTSKKGDRITVQGKLASFEYTSKDGKINKGYEILVDTYSREYRPEDFKQNLQTVKDSVFPVNASLGAINEQVPMFDEDTIPF